MIGSKVITIDAKNFIAGMSSSNFSQDGGLGVSSLGNSESVTVINPTITPGLIYAPSRPVNETPLSDYSGYKIQMHW